MKLYILIMKTLYSNSENFQKCSVCLCFDFVSCLFWGRVCTDSWNGNNKYYIVITPLEQRL